MPGAARYRYDIPRIYLELARSALMPVHVRRPNAQRMESARIRARRLQVAFGAVTISVLFSYLAVEAFVNYQLFQLWKRRHAKSDQGRRFRELLDEHSDFRLYRLDKKIRELPARIKVLYHILGVVPLHISNQTLWTQFIHLVEAGRHFLVHPFPDPAEVQSQIKMIMEDQPAGLWSEVAGALLADLYTKTGRRPPLWTSRNGLLRLLGIRVITRQPRRADC